MGSMDSKLSYNDALKNLFDSSGKIFIGGISPLTTEEKIQKHFEQYGELFDCVIASEKATGKSRCFGFITYKDPEVVNRVLEYSHVIDDRKLDCKRALPRDLRYVSCEKVSKVENRKIFVGGLPHSITESDFKTYFEQFGIVEDSKISFDKETKKPRGFGFITFSTEDAVDKVIANYKDNKIANKWIECKRVRLIDLDKSKSSDCSQSVTKTYNGLNPQNNIGENYNQAADYDNYPMYYPTYNIQNPAECKPYNPIYYSYYYGYHPFAPEYLNNNYQSQQQQASYNITDPKTMNSYQATSTIDTNSSKYKSDSMADSFNKTRNTTQKSKGPDAEYQKKCSMNKDINYLSSQQCSQSKIRAIGPIIGAELLKENIEKRYYNPY